MRQAGILATIGLADGLRRRIMLGMGVPLDIGMCMCMGRPIEAMAVTMAIGGAGGVNQVLARGHDGHHAPHQPIAQPIVQQPSQRMGWLRGRLRLAGNVAVLGASHTGDGHRQALARHGQHQQPDAQGASWAGGKSVMAKRRTRHVLQVSAAILKGRQVPITSHADDARMTQGCKAQGRTGKCPR